MKELSIIDGLKEVSFYKKMDGHLQCMVCPHYCMLKVGQKGVCRVRQNIQGKLYALNYGKCSSYGVDPIEKKPLRNYHPGSPIFFRRYCGMQSNLWLLPELESCPW